VEAFSRAAAHAGAAGSAHSVPPPPPPPLQEGSVGLLAATETLIVSVLKTPFTEFPGPRDSSAIVIVAFLVRHRSGWRVMVRFWLFSSPQAEKSRVVMSTLATVESLLATAAGTCGALV